MKWVVPTSVAHKGSGPVGARDLVGNRLRRTIDKTNPADDRTDVVTFDTSDRLLTEQRYANLTGTGTPIQTTNYTWNGTQQASKAVAIPSTSTVTQTMSYGLTGQLERVITETKNGSNQVTARTQVEYRYDANGFRFVAVDSSDNNLGTSGIERVENGRTEYLVDHNNATGYGQTLIETVKNAAGQTTQRTSFTFGADEITQTVSTLNPSTGAVTASATHALGHDGHGSVRVLFDASAAVNQVFTYSAYGEFLAIHNGAGVRTSGSAAALANPGDALTKQLYNGENLDPRTGLYNFRARWYAAGSGRFERLDPFAGNPLDPFSFHKYGFVHGDPVMGVDPSGMFEGLIGIMSMANFQSVISNIDMQIGQSILNSFGYTDFYLDPRDYLAAKAASLVGKLIPQWVKDEASNFLKHLNWPMITLVAGAATIGVAAVIGVHQQRVLDAMQVERKLVSQLNLASRVAEIAETFVDEATGGFMRYREALGLARLETYTGRVLKAAKDGSYDAIDGLFGRISLKGPLIHHTTRQLLVNETTIEGLFKSVVKSAKESTAYDTLVVDLGGFSKAQFDGFVGRLEQEALSKPIQIIY